MLRNAADAFTQAFSPNKQEEVKIDETSGGNNPTGTDKLQSNEMTEKIKAQGNTGEEGSLAARANEDTQRRAERFGTQQPTQ